MSTVDMDEQLTSFGILVTVKLAAELELELVHRGGEGSRVGRKCLAIGGVGLGLPHGQGTFRGFKKTELTAWSTSSSRGTARMAGEGEEAMAYNVSRTINKG